MRLTELIRSSAPHSRRQILKAAGAAALAGFARPSSLPALTACSVVAAPSLTEGPYFVDEILHRSDIRADPSDGSIQQGLPLDLTINVSRVDDCVVTPMPGAFVDIWQCNALGVYSDIAAQNVVGKKFLRGYQISDRAGQVQFRTVYPGWYSGRAVHIHYKVRFFSRNQETYEFTSQFFFDDSVSDQVFQLAPYNQKGSPDTRNSTDSIYRGASTTGAVSTNSGSLLLLDVKKDESLGSTTFNLVLDVAAGSTPDDTGGGAGPGGPPAGGGARPPA
jgi:protocatechuate 3,4-dioxygenase beta subunit